MHGQPEQPVPYRAADQVDSHDAHVNRDARSSAARGVSRRIGARAVLLLAAAACVLTGCGTPYLMQAASGEWQVLRARVPIDR